MRVSACLRVIFLRAVCFNVNVAAAAAANINSEFSADAKDFCFVLHLRSVVGQS